MYFLSPWTCLFWLTGYDTCSCDWLLSLNLCFFKVHVCCSTYRYFNTSYWWIILHCMDILCLSIHQWTIWVVFTSWIPWIMLLTFVYKFLCGCVFYSLGVCVCVCVCVRERASEEWNSCSTQLLCFLTFSEAVKQFSKLHHFTSLRAMYEGFNFSPSLPTLVISLFNWAHPSGCEVVSYGGFAFYFLNN